KAIGSYRFTKNLIYFIEMPLSNPEVEDETKANIINLALDVRMEVKKFFAISIKIGLGRCYDGIDQMYESYQEAYRALKYPMENTNIVQYEDIEHFMEYNLDDKLKNNYGEKFALFKAVKQYLTDNLKEDINLKDTASKFNLSPYYFS